MLVSTSSALNSGFFKTSLMRLLGCTDWRAGLSIHRTQAGRIGSSPGRGRREEARRTTTSPTTDSVTSAPGRPGGATRVLGPVPARVRNPRHRSRPPQRARARCPTVTAPGPPQRARARCPAGGLRNPGWGTRRRHRTRPPLRAGVGAAWAYARAGPRGPLTLRTSRTAGCHSGLRGAGSPDWIATAGPAPRAWT